MQPITVTIEGTTPLIVNKFSDEAQFAATSGNSTNHKASRAPREEAESRLYTDAQGKPVMPQPNIFRCIIDAGKFFKLGKSKVTTFKTSLIPACLSVEGILFPIESEQGWSVDQRPIRNPSTGGRFLRFRPIFHDWRITFPLALDEEIMSLQFLREILDAAGKRIGLGDFRPDCKGPFGKFTVTHWNKG